MPVFSVIGNRVDSVSQHLISIVVYTSHSAVSIEYYKLYMHERDVVSGENYSCLGAKPINILCEDPGERTSARQLYRKKASKSKDFAIRMSCAYAREWSPHVIPTFSTRNASGIDFTNEFSFDFHDAPYVYCQHFAMHLGAMLTIHASYPAVAFR